MLFFSQNISYSTERFFEITQVFFEKLIKFFPTFWHYTLFYADKNPITVSKLIFGIFFIIFGYLMIRFGIKQFDKKILGKLNVDIPHRYTIKVFLFYFLLSFLFLFILYFIQIPLTVFTFLGGALALGIGFGTKNIMNNLICGIVIVAEHPIRIGDWIEVNDLSGVVEHIGFRATSLRSLQNTHILIPNSIILEHSILNWTLSDKVIRSQIKVGVSYSSDVDKIKQILLKIINDHSRVLSYNKSQLPVVFFSDFGDNALIFTINYWIAITNYIDLKIVSSELRTEIQKQFKKEGILIPFNQRDIHVKSPIQVQLMQNKKI